MRLDRADLAGTAVLAAGAWAAAAAHAPTAVTAVLGIGLLAAPGYLWSEVMLGPRAAGLERLAVAAALALAVPILGGLALFAAGVPLHRMTWVILLAAVTLAGDAALLARRPGRRAPSRPGRHHQAGPAVTRPLPAVRQFPVRHAAAFGAAVVIAAGGVGLARAGVARQQQPAFTQLWLAPRGSASSATTASLGVTNDQGGTRHYRLVLTGAGHAAARWDITLADGQTWQRQIPFTSHHLISADLYLKPDLTHPYRHVATDEQAPGR